MEQISIQHEISGGLRSIFVVLVVAVLLLQGITEALTKFIAGGRQEFDFPGARNSCVRQEFTPAAQEAGRSLDSRARGTPA